MHLTDAHNHLQDPRLGPDPEPVVAAARAVGVRRMVVNGSDPSDWPDVARLAVRHPDLVIPSFGVHPWQADAAGPGWEADLGRWLERHPGAGVGEIGLDRWMLDNPGRWQRMHGVPDTTTPPSRECQAAVFTAQMRIASDLNRPATIHCLSAWGDLLDGLRRGPVPSAGFLLHSYGGPVELVGPLARLGARFGFPGYFLHRRKARQREVFRHIPSDRLLVETDAPDQRLPDDLETHRLADPATGQPVNHPANLAAVYSGLAEFLGEPVEGLAERVRGNFEALFGSPRGQPHDRPCGSGNRAAPRSPTTPGLPDGSRPG